MAYSESTTIGEINFLVTKALRENDIFRIGKKGVAKAFLQDLLELSHETSYADVEAAYKKTFPRKGTPDASEEFWLFIEKDYLYLEVEPKTTFTELSLQVVEDLRQIAEHLKYISKEKQILEEKNMNEGRLSADERYYKNQLEYFENKNILARDEIVDFMGGGIKSYAIRKGTKIVTPFSLNLFYNHAPYTFGRKPTWSLYDPYDVRSLDQYLNKFSDLPISAYKELVESCRKGPESFKEIAGWYIAGDESAGLASVRAKIEDFVGKSHILARRKQVIFTMLSHFEKKDYISFVSIAPLQIEGIFADICREVGVSEKQLDISSLNNKLQHIDGKLNSFFYFEYYSFKFPVLRNLVAHGGLVDSDLEDTAMHLILDLLPVCGLTVSKEIPINHALLVVDEASKFNYERLIEWLDLRESVEISDFYGIKEKIIEMEKLYLCTEFWEHLENKLKALRKVEQIKTSAPIRVAAKIKSSGLATVEAGRFLKSAYQVACKAIKERDETSDKLKKYMSSRK